MNIISSALELRDEGIDPPIEELCLGHEELVPAVREALGLASELPRMQAEGSRRDDHLGRVLRDRYRLDQRLGAGAMGVVYAAEDLELGRSVAVKILRTDVLGAEEATARFLREAEVMAVVKHPAVITVHDRGTTESDEHFLVMELLDGESLSTLLESQRTRSSRSVEDTEWIARGLKVESFPEKSYLRTVVQWVADLASGLESAHQAGVYHRDVKPSNVFIKKDGSALLLDFGIAASTEHATLMRDSGALGTPAYMAPESLDPDRPASASLDIYSLCATLYHLLVLRAPYTGTPSQIISSLKDSEPVAAYRLRKGLPRDLQAILDRGMARRPSQRYLTASDLEADLRAFLDYRPVSARPITPLGRSWRRLRRKPAFYAAVGLAVASLGFAGGKEWLEDRREVMHERFMDVYEHYPASFTVESPFENRQRLNPEEQAALLALLNQGVELAADPRHSLLLRASFLLDHGDPAAAYADMSRLAERSDTPLARDLASRFRSLPADASDAFAVDLTDLPEPRDTFDAFLSGYMKFRQVDIKSAQRNPSLFDDPFKDLSDPRLAGFTPATELLIPMIAIRSGALSKKEREIILLENYARAVRLEEQLGRRTASSAFMVGFALQLQNRYDEAFEVFVEGVELSEYSFGLRLNAASAGRRLRRVEEAESLLRRALELRPRELRPFEVLARLYIGNGLLDRASEVVADAPFPETPEGLSKRAQFEADVEAERAMLSYEAGDEAAAREAAGAALDCFEEADSYGKPISSSNRVVCEGLLADDPTQILEGLTRLLRPDPLRWRRLGMLIDWIPDDPEPADLHALRSYLRALKKTLSVRGD